MVKRCQRVLFAIINVSTLCLKNVPTFELSVTLSNLNHRGAVGNYEISCAFQQRKNVENR